MACPASLILLLALDRVASCIHAFAFTSSFSCNFRQFQYIIIKSGESVIAAVVVVVVGGFVTHVSLESIQYKEFSSKNVTDKILPKLDQEDT